MPSRPPAFHPPGWRERKPWQPMEGLKDRRKRGRAGMRERQQVLDEEPYCRICLKHGKRVASIVVDHVTPLAWGGKDVRSNKQGLCSPCHDEKSAAERAAEHRSGSCDFQ